MSKKKKCKKNHSFHHYPTWFLVLIFILTFGWCDANWVGDVQTKKSTFGYVFSFGRRVQMRYHEPHPPLWVTIYWVFILKYFWNILNKSLLKNL
jgi:hypothetical protein